MAYDGWIEFNGIELVNLSRTSQLAEALGIDSVWTNSESVQWIEDALGGSNYDAVSSAPWYDAGFPASGEFAGLIPLSITGLDDSTLEASTIEYITDGGSSGKGRHKTLVMVANVAIIASTPRGAEFGKRWLDRVLRDGGANQFCSGSPMRYFRYPQDEGDPIPPVARRRDVSLTRGTSVTRKRSTACSATWLTTFTWTANDPFEYGDPVLVASNVAGTANSGDSFNYASNPMQAAGGSDDERGPRFGNSISYQSGLALPDAPNTYGRAVETAAGGSGRGVDWYGNVQLANPGTSGQWLSQPVTPGETITVSHYTRWTFTGALTAVLMPRRFHDGVGNWVGASTQPSVGSLVGKSGQWVRYSSTFVVPAGARFMTLGNWASGTSAIGDTMDQTALLIERASVPSPLLPQGRMLMTMSSCPVYDYTPIYDPLYPALVPAPEPPDFYPEGWALVPGVAIRRYWALTPPVEPSALRLVPILTLRTKVAARMVRVQVWPGNSPVSPQCEPLWEAIVSYVPPDVDFVIDGEQEASYAWDRLSPAVRRTDSLVYGNEARPVSWSSFNHPSGLLVTLDVMVDTGGVEYDGNATVSADLVLVPKSD